MVHPFHLVVGHSCGKEGNTIRRSDCRVGNLQGREGGVDVVVSREADRSLGWPGIFFRGPIWDLPWLHRLRKWLAEGVQASSLRRLSFKMCTVVKIIEL
jgi:hypothetical protein